MQDFADECESLLAFLRDRGALSRFWPRLLSRSQQRDEALNEIRVARYLEECGYPVIDWNEPRDAPGSNVEFTVSLGNGPDGFVEVKSPGWEAELSESERRHGRAKQPKYVGMRGGLAGPVQVIRRTVEKARPKFSGNAPSLIVIADDCFVNLGEWGWWPFQMALTTKAIAWGDGLFHKPEYANIGAVSLFWVRVRGHAVEYNSLCLANPHATASAAMPAELVRRLCTKPVNPYA